jgi:hypothetical protein
LALRPLAGALVLTGLLAGCTGADAERTTAGGARSAAPGAAITRSPSASPDGSASSDGSTSSAGVDSFAPGDALVRQTVTSVGEPGDRLDVALLSLRVQGEVMQLRLALTPTFASQRADAEVSQFRAIGETLFSPTLVDAEHLKEYEVVKSAQGRPWRSSDLDTKARNGTPMLAYAWFAAPQDDIDSVDVRVSDAWPAFTDVPITR